MAQKITISRHSTPHHDILQFIESSYLNIGIRLGIIILSTKNKGEEASLLSL